MGRTEAMESKLRKINRGRAGEAESLWTRG